MEILQKFLQDELHESQQKFICSILDYYNEKISLNLNADQEKSRKSSVAALILQCNQPKALARDKKFLTIISLLIMIGISLVDDINDEQLTSVWGKLTKSEISYIVYLLLFILPHRLILKSNYISSSIKLNLINTLSEYYVKISSGEYKQITNSLVDIKDMTLESIMQSMYFKTGEWHALYAAIAICYAGKGASKNNIYIKISREIGVLYQMRNDVYDTFKDAQSQDIINNVFNFPIAAHLVSLEGKKKDDFLGKLVLCREGKISSEELKGEMINGGVLAYVTLIIELQKLKILNLLKELNISKVLHDKFIGYMLDTG